ncbi:MAG: SpoIVB peptidase S55 [Planctomycetes bacterium]|nr:SpoIVB peptidase S55 [Planctomycetota bacterium]
MTSNLLTTVALLLVASTLSAGVKPDLFWNPDDLKPGMKGTGQTVMKGTKIESFDVEILGVLKNTAPGRDMVIARLSGLGLEKTGVIAGMSGSPVTIDGKLVGAVAYAWQFGKEPIAGITPFSQMRSFVEAFEQRERAADKQMRKLDLRDPLKIGGRQFSTVAVSSSFDAPQQVSSGAAADELWMTPLRTPVSATGFSSHSLELFRDQFGKNGLFPVMGGATPAKIAEEERNVALQPGGAMAMAMITGDFDMSGIGTVTHIDGDRVYGWGHPNMGLGACDFPMQTGYIHTVYPRQTVSFKMGSPLKTVGVVNADVSTCIAGTLGRKPDMIPVRLNVRREVGDTRIFNVQIVRQRGLLQSLMFACLTNAIDMEGELPDEMTADIEVTIELEGRAPVVLRDTFSGSSIAAGRAPSALYTPIAQMIAGIQNNPCGLIRIKSIDCKTVIRSGRTSAEIEAVELDADTLAPGETLKATVHLRPWKSNSVRQRIELKLPVDLPEGSYTLTISDDLTRARNDLRDRPDINLASTVDGFLKGLQTFTEGKRTTLAARIPLKSSGVAVGDQPLPNLSPGMVQLLGQSRKTGTQLLGSSLSARQPTEWVIVGTDTITFTVAPRRSKSAP